MVGICISKEVENHKTEEIVWEFPTENAAGSLLLDCLLTEMGIYPQTLSEASVYTAWCNAGGHFFSVLTSFLKRLIAVRSNFFLGLQQPSLYLSCQCTKTLQALPNRNISLRYAIPFPLLFIMGKDTLFLKERTKPSFTDGNLTPKILGGSRVFKSSMYPLLWY